MASPDAGRPHEDALVRSVGPGVSTLHGSAPGLATLADLPNHERASDADLLAALRERDPLALVELYQRTAPAAHAVARRLLDRTALVEAALREVYSLVWARPFEGGSLVAEIRARTFAIAAADLRHRGASPAESSVTSLLDDLPAPAVRHVSAVERALAALPSPVRRAVLLAHDAGIASTSQDDPEAAHLLEAGLLALADPEAPAGTSTPSGVSGLGDWVLGLLSEADATATAAVVRTDAALAPRVATLHLARRKLEGLPASPNTSQRILAQVLAATAMPDPVVLPAPGSKERWRPATRGIGFVAASLVLLLVAGVLLLADNNPVDQQVAVAQAAPVPDRAGAASARAPTAASQRRAVRRERQNGSTPRIVRPAPTDSQAQAAPPVRVTIPTMDVNKRLVGLSVLNDGTLAAPEDYGAPGWYREGVAPGDAGPAVIVGHVDSMDGPAVFFKLETLQPGDKAHIKRADGTTVTFVVDRVERVAKDDFPTQQVYGPTPTPELRLITCGGAFDNTTLSYDDNVIAFAHIQQPRARRDKDQKAEKADKAEKPSDKDALGSYDHLGRLRTPEDDKDKRDRSSDRRRSEPAADA